VAVEGRCEDELFVGETAVGEALQGESLKGEAAVGEGAGDALVWPFIEQDGGGLSERETRIDKSNNELPSEAKEARVATDEIWRLFKNSGEKMADRPMSSDSVADVVVAVFSVLIPHIAVSLASR